MPLFSIYSNSSGETFKQCPMRCSNVVIFYLDMYLLTCYLNAEDFLKSLSSIVKYFKVVSKKYFSLYFTSTKCSLSQSINEICVSCCVLRYGLPLKGNSNLQNIPRRKWEEIRIKCYGYS